MTQGTNQGDDINSDALLQIVKCYTDKSSNYTLQLQTVKYKHLSVTQSPTSTVQHCNSHTCHNLLWPRSYPSHSHICNSTKIDLRYTIRGGPMAWVTANILQAKWRPHRLHKGQDFACFKVHTCEAISWPTQEANQDTAPASQHPVQ
jgi:hypothetical protein